MAEILNPIGGINNKEEAQQAAIRVAEQAKELKKQQKFELQKALEAIDEANPNGENFGEVAAMLALPDEHFNVLAPIFLN
jgi:hypothetical protein